jgi:hypothetical protein
MRAMLLLLFAATAGAEDMTQGAIPGAELVAFAPAKVAGIARSNLLDQAFAVAAAYKLESGYLNLDIQNTFHRGTRNTSIEDLYLGNKKLCGTREKVSGYAACVRVGEDGKTVIHWYLPDRLKVSVAAPTEKLARAMAADLPIAALAKLSATR